MKVIKVILKIFGNGIKYLLLVGILGVLALLLVLYPTLSKDYDEAKKAVAYSTKDTFYPDMASAILDKDGSLICTVTKEHKTFSYLTAENIPENVKHAFIAVEDRTFYNNPGYDWKGQARVLARYVLTNGQEKHGASTITQQLVKLTFLSPEQTLTRKVKELFYAREMAKHYTKEEVLEYYINNCCFGNGIYGIEAAAEQYFGKKAADLTLGETAYLCAIPNSPEYYDPWKDPSRAITRQQKILSDMKDCGYITNAEEKAAKAEQIQVHPKHPLTSAESASTLPREQAYAIHCAVEDLMREDGFVFRSAFSTDGEKNTYDKSYNEAYKNAKEKLYTRRYTIQTALDPAVYEKAQAELDSAAMKYGTAVSDSGIYSFQSALAVFDNTTGKIVAVVGGRSQDNVGSDSLNRGFQTTRQPGSTMKPLFVYAPALDRGYSRSSVLTNVSVSAAKHCKNVAAMGGGKVDLYTALTRSMNGPAYWLSAKIGTSAGMEALQKMRFGGLVPEDNSLSTALGGMTYGTNPVEMAAAYGTFMNQGYYRTPTCVTKVLDMNGTNVYEEPEEEKIYSEKTVDDLADIMKGVLTEGTAKKAGPIEGNIDSAGKTGTTDKTKDVWFTGYTPYYTVSVWMGRDDGKSMEGRISSVTPALLWKSVMTDLVTGKPEAHFESYEKDTAAVSLTLPYMNDPIPYYYPTEAIQNGYSVGDYRNDVSIHDAVVKEAKRFKNQGNRNDEIAKLTEQLLTIRNTDLRKDAENQVISSLVLSGDLTTTEAEQLEGGTE